VLSGGLSVAEVTALGVEVSGDHRVLRRVLPGAPGQPREQQAR